MAKEKKSRDLLSLLLLLWEKRKILLVACFIGGVLSIIVAFSIPRQYTSRVILAPEFSSGSMSVGGGLGSLASMAGINLGGLGESGDAIYPELYPQIISSTPFLCDIMAMPVESKDGDLKTDMYHYLRFEQKEAWWTTCIQAPIRLVKRITTHKVDTIMPTSGSDMMLTRPQQMTMKSLDKKIRVDVDKGNNVITLDVTMQDPLIAAVVARQVSDNLQKYVEDYRTAKARKDLTYTETLFIEAQNKYYNAQQSYARYADQHQNMVLNQYQIELDRLRNEQELAFNVYNQLAGQLEVAKAKVQENTPVCVVMQPSVMPFKASSPKKLMMGIFYVFLAFFGTAAWLIIKELIRQDRVSD
jgi:uncharacterized protein involved in exopolysaccharide biosynthesis